MRACAHCGEPLVRREGDTRHRERKFCDNACRIAAMVGKGISLRHVKTGVDPMWNRTHRRKTKLSDDVKRCKVGEIVKKILAAKKAAK